MQTEVEMDSSKMREKDHGKEKQLLKCWDKDGEQMKR